MRVFNNKHPIIDTRVDLYTIYKRKLKNQPIASQVTYSNMFMGLDEGKWYLIKDLLQEGGNILEEKEGRKESEEK